jgi:hypothetical protein
MQDEEADIEYEALKAELAAQVALEDAKGS